MESKRAVELAEKRRLWETRLEGWRESGLTQVEYCRLHNLDTRNFQYWKKKILPKPLGAALVELPAQFLTNPSLPASSPLCLVINGRFRIEVSSGFDVGTLERLIMVLNRP